MTDTGGCSSRGRWSTGIGVTKEPGRDDFSWVGMRFAPRTGKLPRWGAVTAIATCVMAVTSVIALRDDDPRPRASTSTVIGKHINGENTENRTSIGSVNCGLTIASCDTWNYSSGPFGGTKLSSFEPSTGANGTTSTTIGTVRENSEASRTTAPPFTATTLPTPLATSSSTPVPTAPSDAFLSAVRSSEILVSWRDNSDNEDGFRVTAAVGVFWDVVRNATTYTISGLAPGTYMCINVRAFNSVGESGQIDAGCTTTPPPSVTFCDREGLEPNGGNCETFHESLRQLPQKYSTNGDIWSLRTSSSHVIVYDEPDWTGFQHCYNPYSTENYVVLRNANSFKFASSCTG